MGTDKPSVKGSEEFESFMRDIDRETAEWWDKERDKRRKVRESMERADALEGVDYTDETEGILNRNTRRVLRGIDE